MNENPSAPQTPESAPQVQKPKGWFRWWYVLIAFILVLFLTVLLVTARAFAPWKEVPATAPTFADMTIQYRLMQRFSRELSKQPKSSRKAVLKLSPQEINSLFTFAGNLKPKNSPYPLRYYQFKSYENGVFSVTVPVQTSMTWLWGGTMYAQVAFTVSKAPGQELKVNILSFYLTDWALNFPKILESLNLKAAQEVKKLKIGKELESITFENGQFVIVCDPRLPAQLLFKRKR